MTPTYNTIVTNKLDPQQGNMGDRNIELSSQLEQLCAKYHLRVHNHPIYKSIDRLDCCDPKFRNIYNFNHPSIIRILQNNYKHLISTLQKDRIEDYVYYQRCSDEFTRMTLEYCDELIKLFTQIIQYVKSITLANAITIVGITYYKISDTIVEFEQIRAKYYEILQQRPTISQLVFYPLFRKLYLQRYNGKIPNLPDDHLLMRMNELPWNLQRLIIEKM